MTQNLFAACRTDNGTLIAKRVRLDASTQQAVQDVFARQESEFLAGITSEVTFDGEWNPDDDELLTISTPAEANIFATALNVNAMSIPDINTASFGQESIKALFTGTAHDGTTKVLVQRFTSLQSLERRFTLFQQGNAFRHITESAFTLDSSLTCIIENGLIKFKSQQKLRTIINLLEVYRAATEQEVQAFAAHPKLQIADAAAFAATTNQVSRKLIHAINSAQILDRVAPIVVQQAAGRTGLSVHVQNGKIVMPTEHADIKALLQFLHEDRYAGPLTGTAFVTNSRRRA